MRSKYIIGLGMMVLVVASCHNAADPDSVKQAEQENAAKADSLQKQKSLSDSSTAVPSKQDADFLVKAYSGGMMEVELGKLAMSHGVHKGVKDFGALMLQDHGMGADTLRALALGKKIVLPDSISNQQKMDRTKLQEKHGRDFDRSYINLMVRDHKEDIDEFEKAAKNANDPDIRSFAQRTLTMLHEHLDSAQHLDKRIGKTLSGPNMKLPY